MHRYLVSAVLAAGLSAAVTPTTAANPAAFDLFTVQREATLLSIDIAGTVTARQTVQLSAQVPGRVLRIAGAEGDQFEAGAVLVEIDDKALRAKLDAAVAAREAALAAIRNANVQFDRELRSPQGGASSQAPGGMGMPAMMDQMFTNPMQNMMGMRSRGTERGSDLVARETQIAQANTAYRQAEAQIREVQSSLRDTKSVAPFAGVIETKHVEVGDPVQPGQPLLNYSETAGFQVQADVPVRLRPGLVEGMSLYVQLDGHPPAIPAPITRIFPVADPTQHTVRIELDLPPQTQATVGQYAVVTLPAAGAGPSADLVIPRTAVIKKGGLPLVYSVGPDGRARLRVIRVGADLGQEMCIVLSGIQEGDRIVNNPPPGLRAGTQVLPDASESNNN